MIETTRCRRPQGYGLVQIAERLAQLRPATRRPADRDPGAGRLARWATTTPLAAAGSGAVHPLGYDQISVEDLLTHGDVGPE